MVWLSRIVRHEDGGGEAEVDLAASGLYFDNGRFLPMALCELIAQAYGYIKSMETQARGGKLELCYLAAIDRLEFFDAGPPAPGDRLTIAVRTERDMHPLYRIRGDVTNAAGARLCAAEIKGFAAFEAAPQ